MTNDRYLFRGKRLDNGQWELGDLVHNVFDGTSRTIAVGISTDNSYPIEVDPETVGQFAGMLDKTGSKIFAGDIIHIMRIFGFHGDLMDEWKNLHGLETINGIGSIFKGVVVLDFQRGLMLKRLDNDYAEPLFTRKFNNSCHIDLSMCVKIGNIHDNPEMLL